MNQTSSMTIGQLARAGGVGVETVRYYQRLELLDEPKRAYGSVRRYGGDILERIQFIKRAQRLGFTLAEIKALFRLDAKRDRHRAHKLAEIKLGEIEQRLADMAAMRSALRQLVAACEAGNTDLPCPIVEAFNGSQTAAPARK
jgi:MerR family mercuric resistance operon transcriptional regulator